VGSDADDEDGHRSSLPVPEPPPVVAARVVRVGGPPAAPPPAPAAKAPADHSLVETGRLTLSFEGPALRLPDEPQSGDLRLDTGEFRMPEARAPETGLALDLADVDEKPSTAARGAPAPPPDEPHDAWMRERVARGSRPPSSPRMASTTSVATAVVSRRRLGTGERALPDLEGGAISLIDRSRPSETNIDLATEMADRYALGDFTAALQAAELLLGRDPEHAEAKRFAESSRERLVQIYTSRIGSLKRVPRVTVVEAEVRWLGHDHRAGFLLSRIDGKSSIDEIIDVSGMMRLEALKTLADLVDAGAIQFD
jgi:hypothetical protein